jgi:hypothetical protein
VELTVGRHAADEGAGVDPIVAAALRRRPPSAEPAMPRHDLEIRQRQLTGADGEGGLGWPGDPADGTGLGWPVDQAGPGQSADRGPRAELVAAAEPARRRGWRRLFGSSSAA